MKLEQTQRNFIIFNINKLETVESQVSTLDSIIFYAKPIFDDIEKEFDEISKVQQKSTNIADLPENIHKNRYDSVKPADFSRIVLKTNQVFTSDYINASWIDTTSFETKYIATQGPLKNTVVDFYRMILQYDVNTIVMMTGFCENGIDKCYNYLPKVSSPLLFPDNIKVEFVSSEVLPFAVITTLSISSNTKCFFVKHFQFTLWPDQNIPHSCEDIIVFEKLVREWSNKNLSPIVFFNFL